MIQLNTLEQSFEVAGPETLMVISLDDLKEDSWPILHRLGEDLQKIAIVIIINQNLQFLQLCQVLLHLQYVKNIIFYFLKAGIYLDFRVCKTLPEQIIIGVWNVEELLSSGPQVGDSLDDVV